MITTRDGIEDGFTDLGYGQYNALEPALWIKFDKSELVASGSTVIVETLTNIRRRIELAALPYLKIHEFNLLWSVYEYSGWVSGMTVLAVSFSIPSIVMGIMLVQYNTNLMANDNRRALASRIPV